MNVAELLVEFLSRIGCRQCFSLNGGMAMYLNKALNDNPRIEVTYTHHEQAAVSAAEGFAKANNFQVPGLVCVTAGPGVSNTMTGLLSAYADSTPVIVLAGQVKSSDMNRFGVRTHGVQEISSKDLVTPAVKDFISIDIQNLRSNLKKILDSLKVGRKGPIFIEVPLDIQNITIEDAELLINNVMSQSSYVNEELPFEIIHNLKTVISESSRISLYLGNGVRIAGQSISNLIRICDELLIPRFYSWLSQDLENYSNALNFHCPGSLAPIYSNRTIQESDLVIFIGARLDLATTAFQRSSFGFTNRRVIFDIDHLELEKFENHENQLLVEINLEAGLDFLCQLLETHASNDKKWIQNSLDFRETNNREEEIRLRSKELTTRTVTHAICKSLESGTLVMTSSGYAAEGFARFFRGNEHIRFFHGGGLGSMGQGLANGIGAVRARSNKSEPVWIVESDGGLWMSIHEIMTLKHIENENVILFILNNNGYASIKNSQVRHFSDHFGTSSEDGLLFPDWERLFLGLEIDYIKVEDSEKIDFFTLKGKRNLLVVEVVLGMDEDRGPSLRTKITQDGPKTDSLKDISW
jgi:acetolactate synthase I/II/III large subunit